MTSDVRLHTTNDTTFPKNAPDAPDRLLLPEVAEITKVPKVSKIQRVLAKYGTARDPENTAESHGAPTAGHTSEPELPWQIRAFGGDGDAAPVLGRSVSPPGPYVQCEKCWFDFHASGQREAQPFDQRGYAHAPTATQLKPEGAACPRCGDDSPRGTFPWNGSPFSRVEGVVLHTRLGEAGPWGRADAERARVVVCRPVGEVKA